MRTRYEGSLKQGEVGEGSGEGGEGGGGGGERSEVGRMRLGRG